MLRPSFVFVVGARLVAGAVFAAPPTTYYRSIGSAPDYATGTVTAINGETCVVGSLDVQWKTANRGRGDRIIIAGTDYTILSVDAENELTLTTTVSGNFTGAYNIARQFTTLQEGEDSISFAVACAYFPVSSASLVADNRREVGIAYNDSIVPTDPDFTAGVLFDGSTTDASHDITLTTTPPSPIAPKSVMKLSGMPCSRNAATTPISPNGIAARMINGCTRELNVIARTT